MGAEMEKVGQWQLQDQAKGLHWVLWQPGAVLSCWVADGGQLCG